MGALGVKHCVSVTVERWQKKKPAETLVPAGFSFTNVLTD
jgi:hypothetical protein